MLSLVMGVFLVLHGLVHLLYFGQSWRLFVLQPGLTWPDGAWAFRFLAADTTRLLASAACVLAAVAFAGGGIGLLLSQSWWRPAVVGAATFSAIVYILLWNGKLDRLPDQGAVGILINIAILAAVLVLRVPDFGARVTP